MSNKAFAIGGWGGWGYAGMEMILLPQSVTNISLSKCRLIYEGRQCSLQTARRYVPSVINLRSQRWAIHVNRPVWIHAPAERPTFSRNTNTFRVLVIYFVNGLSLRTCRVCSCVGLCVRMIVSKEPLCFRLHGILIMEALSFSETSSDTRKPLSLYLMPWESRISYLNYYILSCPL